MRSRIRWGLAVVITLTILVVCPSAEASDDKYSSRQWALRRVGAEKAWAVDRGKGVTIAILDTGVDPRHEDLSGNVVSGYDFIESDSNPSDEHGHGTHVAGIAAARANNDVGIAGVAPEARIMPVRVLDEEGSDVGSSVEDGVRWAVDHGADVVNLSLGSDVITENLTGGTLTDAVNYAWSKGVVPVIAAGNDRLFRTELRDANTLIVTATTPDDTKASYATEVGFAKWGIAAPGGTDVGGKENMVYSTLWAKKEGVHYGWAMGTSMAAPHVAGAAAILRGAGLSPQRTVDTLLATAKDLGSSGDDSTYGHGRLDVAAAVAGLPRAKTPSSSSGGSSDPIPAEDGGTAPATARPVRTDAATGTDPPDRSPTAEGSDDEASPSPTSRSLASEDDESSSRVPNLIVGAALLATAGGLIALGRMRQIRGRREG